MIVAKQQLTLAEFLEQPETKPASEYINGIVYQKPMPQGEHSLLQTRLSTAINQHSEVEQTALALTELRCTFGGRSIVPDIAVFRWERIPRTEKGRIANRFEIYPDWVIEILSPEQSANQIIEKIIFCIHQGTQLGWLIDPKDESIMILKPNQLPDVKSENNILPGLDVLGDLQLTVNQIFNWLNI